jgi:predicted cobalt transporter CbtA
MNAINGFLGSTAGLVATLVAAALGVYLLATHTGHILSALPYMLLLACPLMHLFGHHHHSSHKSETGRSTEAR